MPKKFTEEERLLVQRKLLEAGRRSFEAFGLKKTSVEDLTKAAGISQGAFYLFYGSKEELLFELMQEDERRIRNAMLESFQAGKNITEADLKQFLLQSLRMIDETPLLKMVILKKEMELLLRKLPKELLERNFSEDADALAPIISLWQSNAIMADAPLETVVSMIRSLILLTLHREEIGEDQFEPTMELLAGVIAAGMIAWKKTERNNRNHD